MPGISRGNASPSPSPLSAILLAVNPLEDPFELGRRISAARGYAQIQRPELGERLGVDVKQVRLWETGRDLGESVEERRGLAERVVEATEAPRFFFGLPDGEADLERRVEVLELDVAELRRADHG